MPAKSRTDRFEGRPSMRRSRRATPSADGRSTRQKGADVETTVATWLGTQGYQIICRNFRCRLGELDIVASHDGHLAFIEVRSRASARYGTALQAISPSKADQVAKVAAYYLAFYGDRWAAWPKRFDVVAVTGGEPVLIKDAFRLGELRYRFRV